MELLLHPTNSQLSHHYRRAFKNAAELFVVSAYLTEWESALQLSPKCRSFRIIIGRNFGITRKKACEDVMRWLPPKRKAQFMVADQIGGFHPKAVFWKEEDGNCFALVGSSNLTQAAFKSNYEANIFLPLNRLDYEKAKKWVRSIESRSIVVSEDWLRKYKEARINFARKGVEDPGPVLAIKLPTPAGMEKHIAQRRKALAAYDQKKVALNRLFRQCASKRISSLQFYEELPRYWSQKTGDRLQGAGFEIKGKHGDFQALSRSFVNILDASPEDRDNVVSEEIDLLSDKQVPTRTAFLSEMLCLRFPDEYPLLNQPVRDYLKKVKYKAPRRASEGARFLHLAKALRYSLLQNPHYPAKNLAELDAVIRLEW